MRAKDKCITVRDYKLQLPGQHMLWVYGRCHFFDVPKPAKPIIAIISFSSCCIAVSFASSTRACCRFAFFSAFFSARAAASRSRISASRCSKSNDFALEASLVFSRRYAIRALTCSTVDRSIRVVWPRARKSDREARGQCSTIGMKGMDVRPRPLM